MSNCRSQGRTPIDHRSTARACHTHLLQQHHRHQEWEVRREWGEESKREREREFRTKDEHDPCLVEGSGMSGAWFRQQAKAW
jgi:hypothetical protein